MRRSGRKCSEPDGRPDDAPRSAAFMRQDTIDRSHLPHKCGAPIVFSIAFWVVSGCALTQVFKIEALVKDSPDA